MRTGILSLADLSAELGLTVAEIAGQVESGQLPRPEIQANGSPTWDRAELEQALQLARPPRPIRREWAYGSEALPGRLPTSTSSELSW